MADSIVFFGSGPVAAKSLTLLKQKVLIEAVITKPSTVSMMQEAASTTTYAVATRAELDTLIAAQSFKSQLAVLIDFGIIVSRAVIDKFKLGIINSHFSLLPQWRGADPITFAVLSGQKATGVSLMLLVEAMDEGPLLAQQSLVIEPSDTGPSLTGKLIGLSGQMLIDNLPKYLASRLTPYPQKSEGVSYSRKISKEDGIIDWHKSATELEREIRAFIDWPKSRTWLGEIEVIITRASTGSANLAPGEISASRDQLLIGTGEKSLNIESLKPAGKQEMTAAEFIRGYGDRIGHTAKIITRG